MVAAASHLDLHAVDGEIVIDPELEVGAVGDFLSLWNGDRPDADLHAVTRPQHVRPVVDPVRRRRRNRKKKQTQERDDGTHGGPSREPYQTPHEKALAKVGDLDKRRRAGPCAPCRSPVTRARRSSLRRPPPAARPRGTSRSTGSWRGTPGSPCAARRFRRRARRGSPSAPRARRGRGTTPAPPPRRARAGRSD